MKKSRSMFYTDRTMKVLFYSEIFAVLYDFAHHHETNVMHCKSVVFLSFLSAKYHYRE